MKSRVASLAALAACLAAASAAGQGQAAQATAASCLPDCSNQTLTAPNFSHQNLTNAKFVGATIIGASFVRANLAGAKFDNAKFQSVPGSPTQTPDFSFANLTGASFTGALYQAPTYFTYATLTCADFSHGSINSGDPNGHAIFGEEPLTYEVRNDCRVKFQDTTMSCEFINDWKNFDLTGARVRSCLKELSGRDFSGALLSGVDLSFAVLDGSLFVKADLRNANLNNVSLQCLDPPEAPQKPGSRCVDMSAALLQSAHLANANLSGANLDHAQLSNDANGTNPAFLTQAHLRNVNLSFAQLSGVDFTWANFYGTIAANPGGCNTPNGKYTGFTGICASAHQAVMTATKFGNAYLYGVDFSDAAISGADFTQAILVGANFADATITTNPNGGATSFFRAYLQGTNLDQFNPKFSLQANLSNAFLDFRTGGNLVAIDLSSSHNQFAACAGPPKLCRVPPGKDVCVGVRYPLTTVPSANTTITCPNGSPAPSGGCGTDFGRGTSLWQSNVTIGSPPDNSGIPPGWYVNDATFEDKTPLTSFCNGNGFLSQILDW